MRKSSMHEDVCPGAHGRCVGIRWPCELMATREHAERRLLKCGFSVGSRLKSPDIMQRFVSGEILTTFVM